MKALYGIELKNVEIDIGVEHERMTADIYLDNRKLGEVLNDGWADENYLEFKSNRSKVKFEKILQDNSISADEFIDKILFINNVFRWTRDNTLRDCFQLSFIGGNYGYSG